MTLPAADGWRMPAEWEPHEATWIAWPHQLDDWPDKFPPIPWVYAEIVRLLHDCERVRILTPDANQRDAAHAALEANHVDLRQVDFYLWPTDRCWTRDYGPLFLTSDRGQLAVTDWRFNAWAKYDNWLSDDAIPAQVARQLATPSWQPTCHGQRVVLEGGSIDVNGQGLLLTTEECLLSKEQERNPGMTRADYERVFADYLAVEKVIWLGRGIVGDDTHGHVDDIARFINPTTVVVAVERNTHDANYVLLQDNLQRLKAASDQHGHRLDVVPLPMPKPVFFSGQRLPASYANFYIANNRVLVPTFNDPYDRVALGILAELFSDHEVVGIHAVDLVWGLGTLHCLTQQQPAVP